jgi:hypothetical protein
MIDNNSIIPMLQRQAFSLNSAARLLEQPFRKIEENGVHMREALFRPVKKLLDLTYALSGNGLKTNECTNRPKLLTCRKLLMELPHPYHQNPVKDFVKNISWQKRLPAF